MAWNARSLLGLALVGVASQLAQGQVMPDDHPDAAAPTQIGLGTTLGRFDHRAPRSSDTDGYRLRGIPGHAYRVQLIVDRPAPDERRASNTWNQPANLFGFSNILWLHPFGGNDSFVVAGEEDALILVEGLAMGDGNSVPYRVVVDDLGTPPNDPFGSPADASQVQIGEWFEGEISRSADWPFDALEDVDVFAVPVVAGRRYVVVCEVLDAAQNRVSAVFGGYPDGADPRHPVYSNLLDSPFGESTLDTVVPGTMVVRLGGHVASADEVIHYRARVVDQGPARFDDHADWSQGATPITPGTPIGLTLNDVPQVVFGSALLDDTDCFKIELLAGHRYSISLKPGAGTIIPSWSAEFDVCFEDSRNPLVSGRNSPCDFKPPVSGRYTISCRAWGRTLRRVLLVDDLGQSGDDYPDTAIATQPVATAGVISGVLEDAADRDVIRIDAPTNSIVRATLIGEPSLAGPIVVSLGVLYPSGYLGETGRLFAVDEFGGTQSATLAAGEPYYPQPTPNYLVVSRPYASETDAPRAYSIALEVIPPAEHGDDWADSASGALNIAPGEPVRWAQSNFNGDIDVFTVDLVAGHIYQLAEWAWVFPAGAAVNFDNPPAWPGTLVQPAVSGRYQLVYTAPVSRVGIQDQGAVVDDFRADGPFPKKQVGEAVHGRFDFPGDTDWWLVSAEDDGVYQIRVASSASYLRVGFDSNDVANWVAEPNSGQDGVYVSSALFAPIASFGPLNPIAISVFDQGFNAPDDYTVTVSMVQPFRHADGGPVDLPIGEWVAVRAAVDYGNPSFRVPVVAGHRYQLEEGPGIYSGHLIGIVDADGAQTGGVRSWRPRVSGTSIVTFYGASWVRARVTDLGPVQDDHGGSWETATALPLRQTVSGWLDFSDDTDAFNAPLNAGTVYTARLEFPSSDGFDAVQWSAEDTRTDGSWGIWSSASSWDRTFQFSFRSVWGGEPGLFSLRLPENAPAPVPYTLTIWPYCAADLGSAGGEPTPDGQIDNNDFIVFIDRFFSNSTEADIGKAGGLEGPDDALDNNDFIVFISRFFTGCP